MSKSHVKMSTYYANIEIEADICLQIKASSAVLQAGAAVAAATGKAAAAGSSFLQAAAQATSSAQASVAAVGVRLHSTLKISSNSYLGCGLFSSSTGFATSNSVAKCRSYCNSSCSRYRRKYNCIRTNNYPDLLPYNTA